MTYWAWWSWLLTVIGVTGLYFAGQRKPWAWLIGLGAQVLWMIYAVTTHQWGFIVSAFAYGGVYARNALLWMRKPDESNLVTHARRELALINEEPDVVAGYLRVIQAFADMDHSGGSASVAIPVINELLQFKNLSPLTDDPAEWMHVAEETWGSPGGIWQSTRDSEAFSNDGGKTYYLLSEGGNDKHREPLHTSRQWGDPK